MAQIPDGTYPIDPYSTSGVQLAQKLNDKQEADISSHSGISLPSYGVLGTVWLNTASTVHVMNFYSGTQSKEIYKYDSVAQEIIFDGGTF